MARLVLLEYMFLFDSSELWGRLDDFEKDLARFFDSYGLGAEVVKIAGLKGRKLIIVSKKHEIEPLTEIPGQKKRK